MRQVLFPRSCQKNRNMSFGPTPSIALTFAAPALNLIVLQHEHPHFARTCMCYVRSWTHTGANDLSLKVLSFEINYLSTGCEALGAIRRTQQAHTVSGTPPSSPLQWFFQTFVEPSGCLWPPAGAAYNV